MTLAELDIGVPARVTNVETSRSVIFRLMEMGLVAGAAVEIRKIAPLGDPMELKVRGYSLSIRRSEARCFEVTPEPLK
jgi:Fe2+ transport system protein FeoA